MRLPFLQKVYKIVLPANLVKLKYKEVENMTTVLKGIQTSAYPNKQQQSSTISNGWQ